MVAAAQVPVGLSFLGLCLRGLGPVLARFVFLLSGVLAFGVLGG